MEIYVVKPGDSVDTIAAAYGVLPESVIDVYKRQRQSRDTRKET